MHGAICYLSRSKHYFQVKSESFRNCLCNTHKNSNVQIKCRICSIVSFLEKKINRELHHFVVSEFSHEVLFCRKCSDVCERDWLCASCYEVLEIHQISHPNITFEEYIRSRRHFVKQCNDSEHSYRLVVKSG